MANNNQDFDILAKPETGKKSLLGSSVKSKVINIAMLVILAGVLIWCGNYKYSWF